MYVQMDLFILFIYIQIYHTMNSHVNAHVTNRNNILQLTKQPQEGSRFRRSLVFNDYGYDNPRRYNDPIVTTPSCTIYDQSYIFDVSSTWDFFITLLDAKFWLFYWQIMW